MRRGKRTSTGAGAYAWQTREFAHFRRQYADAIKPVETKAKPQTQKPLKKTK